MVVIALWGADNNNTPFVPDIRIQMLPTQGGERPRSVSTKVTRCALQFKKKKKNTPMLTQLRDARCLQGGAAVCEL